VCAQVVAHKELELVEIWAQSRLCSNVVAYQCDAFGAFRRHSPNPVDVARWACVNCCGLHDTGDHRV
jgi:hypothetical protein